MPINPSRFLCLQCAIVCCVFNSIGLAVFSGKKLQSLCARSTSITSDYRPERREQDTVVLSEVKTHVTIFSSSSCPRGRWQSARTPSLRSVQISDADADVMIMMMILVLLLYLFGRGQQHQRR